MEWDTCIGAVRCTFAAIYDYQNLISGVVAVVAAVIGARAILSSARVPILAARRQQAEMDRRRLTAGCNILAAEFIRVSGLARQAGGTIKVTIAGNHDVTENTRDKTILPLPDLINDLEFFSLLTAQTVRLCNDVRLQIEAHNFDMRRAGGSFGDDNFRRHVQEQVAKIAVSTHELSTAFYNEVRRANSATVKILGAEYMRDA